MLQKPRRTDVTPPIQAWPPSSSQAYQTWAMLPPAPCAPLCLHHTYGDWYCVPMKPWWQRGSTQTSLSWVNHARQMTHLVKEHTASSISAEYSTVGIARIAATSPFPLFFELTRRRPRSWPAAWPSARQPRRHRWVALALGHSRRTT
jgi:hypothetical protein